MTSAWISARTLGLVLLLCAASAHAQIYKWTDDKGVVHFSDVPPPADQKLKVEQKAYGSGETAVELPYELAQAVSRHPVTLYTTSSCGACDQGRSLLLARGVPFAEKTVKSNDDQARLKQAGSDGELPLLLVGSNKLIGFEVGAWSAALNDAAYPAESRLPASYRQVLAESAAPPRAPAPPKPTQQARAAERAAAAEAAAEAARRQKAATEDTAAPKFQF